MSSTMKQASIITRKPVLRDAAPIHRLVTRSAPLDRNSLYCYLLVCDHFRNTSIVAEHQAAVVGFISAYIPPEKPGTLFVWQVAVDRNMRNRALASKMLQELLDRVVPAPLMVETTVTPSNRASLAFFRTFADRRNVPFSMEPCYGAALFGAEEHEEELLVRIGPFGSHGTGTIKGENP